MTGPWRIAIAWVVGLALVTSSDLQASGTPEVPPRFVLKWGSVGSADGQFIHPNGLAIGDDGLVYVVDTFNARVQVFTRDGTFVRKWGNSSTFYDIRSIAVSRAGNVFVVDLGESAIFVFTRDGQFVSRWGVAPGGEPGRFYHPYGVAVDDSGYVYVTDSENRRIQKFTYDGTLVALWSVPIEIGYLSGIGVSRGGWVYVCDTAYNRLYKFTSAGVYMGFIASNPILAVPTAVAVDAMENIYVADGGHRRIVKLTAEGKLLTTWGPGGGGDCQFLHPSGVAVDEDGSVFVSDPSNYSGQLLDPACIQKFAPPETPTRRTTWGDVKILYR